MAADLWELEESSDLWELEESSDLWELEEDVIDATFPVIPSGTGAVRT